MVLLISLAIHETLSSVRCLLEYVLWYIHLFIFIMQCERLSNLLAEQ